MLEFDKLFHDESTYAILEEALGESIQGLGIQKASRKAFEGVLKLAQDVGIPPSLKDHGIQSQEIPRLAEKAYQLSQRLMAMNIEKMAEEDALQILGKAHGGLLH